MNDLLSRLDETDDPALWIAVLNYLQPEPGTWMEIGRCSHWLSPHQTRWTADGGFALPAGYSRMALPQFDWSLTMVWDGARWLSGRRPQRVVGGLRLAIPSRTRRHQQAAVHARWQEGGEFRTEYYGFRQRPEGWVCTADTTLMPEASQGRKPRRPRQER